MSSTFAKYLSLTKPRIASLVLVTAAIGYLLGAQGDISWWVLSCTLVGTALSGGGASALNCFLERDIDARMVRTCKRVLPAGELSPANALAFGLILSVSGVILMAWQANLLTGFLSLLTVFIYVLIYTPLKRITWLNTTIGAIPGAIPPMGGWAAATGNLGLGAWVLFLILFVWQHPHFYSIAWMYKDDYERGGLKMLPVVKPDSANTFCQIIAYSLLLIPVSLLPVFLGLSGPFYLWGSIIAGVLFLGYSIALIWAKTFVAAKSVLRISILYLPTLLALIMADVQF